MNKIRVAMIGVGERGLDHLDCLFAKFRDEVEISGILCSTPESTFEKALDLELPYFNSVEEISKDNTDAVIITTKSNKHTLFGRMMLNKGLPALIEKPFTTNLAEAKDLALLAKQKNTFVMVGHSEQFNPAYQEMCKMAVLPFRDLKAYRMINSPHRCRDISVVLDLMIQERMQSQFAKWREAETGKEKKADYIRLETEYEKAISALSEEQKDAVKNYCDSIFDSGAESECFFYRLGLKDGIRLWKFMKKLMKTVS